MSTPKTDEEIVAIDPAVREVMREFEGDAIALAAEVVALREELAAALPRTLERAPMGFRPPDPPDAPPPIRMTASKRSTKPR